MDLTVAQVFIVQAVTQVIITVIKYSSVFHVRKQFHYNSAGIEFLIRTF